MAVETEKIYEARPPPEIPFDPAVPPPLLKLTDAQQKLYDEVLSHFDKEDFVLPGVEDGALTEEERFWLVRLPCSLYQHSLMRAATIIHCEECRVFGEVWKLQLSQKSPSLMCILKRFLRAVKWASAQAAIKRLEATLKWRREYGLYDLITASHVEPEVPAVCSSAIMETNVLLGSRRSRARW